MDPDRKTPPNIQGVYGPTVQASEGPGIQPSAQPPQPLKRSKRPFLVISGMATLLVLVVLGIAVYLSHNKKTPEVQTQNTPKSTNNPQGPQPATAVSTEQANNAISQEIGNLNDDHDFPDSQLTDNTLKL